MKEWPARQYSSKSSWDMAPQSSITYLKCIGFPHRGQILVSMAVLFSVFTGPPVVIQEPKAHERGLALPQHFEPFKLRLAEVVDVD